MTPEKAALFLQLLQQECDEQTKVTNSERTIISRVLQQMPKIVEAMNLFTSSIDVPASGSQGDGENGKSAGGVGVPVSSLSGSNSEENGVGVPQQRHQEASAGEEAGGTADGKSGVVNVIKVTYTPSAYE